MNVAPDHSNLKLSDMARATIDDIGHLHPAVQNRVLHRMRTAYWLGVSDGVEISDGNALITALDKAGE